MNERITLNINGNPIHFDVTPEKHERLVDEMQANSKVAPMHNFLTRCVEPDSREDLAPYLKNAANAMQLGGQLIEAFTPKLKITVGE